MSFVTLYIGIFANVLLIYHLIVTVEGVQITINQGILEGISLTNRNGAEYFAFYKIPFAQPPVGELRFADPQEPDSWKGVRDATQHATECVQLNNDYEVSGKEDCLYLNVLTPYKSVSGTTPLLPTMVFIHGGGMVNGSPALYEPDYFMDNLNIVFASMQFRVNVFGFLSATDDVLPGNYGMKDQVAALKWVQKNIATFGGDPNRVTIFGCSSGGANVHLHMHSPLSKGLFQQAISQSGSALANWAVNSTERALEKAISFAERSKCPIKPTSEFVKCLRQLSALQLLEYHNSFKDKFGTKKPFLVVVEKKTVKNAFLIENPRWQNVVSEVPWMTGLVSGEGGYKAVRLLTRPEILKDVNLNYKQYFSIFFGYDWMEEAKASETSETLKKFYFDNDAIDKDIQKLVDIYTDGYYAVDGIEAAKRYNREFYFYFYDHRNVHTFNEFYGLKEYEGPDLGVTHADEFISLFFMPTNFPKVTEGPDFEVSKKMIKYWTNFAIKGNPNGEKEVWKATDSSEFEYLHIKTDTDVMEKNLWAERFEFWKSLPLFEKYRKIDASNEK